MSSRRAGIGRSINSVDQIDALTRPLTMEHGGIVLMDLLWSDPTTNDGVEGVQPSPRGPGLVTFGPDRVKEFCKVHEMLRPCDSHFVQTSILLRAATILTTLAMLFHGWR